MSGLNSRLYQHAVLIPAYKPSPGLARFVHELLQAGFGLVTLIDDGSGSDYQAVFTECQAIDGCEVWSHCTNLGKGAALKTGFNQIHTLHPEIQWIVTADADGQHLLADILQVAQDASQQGLGVTLGVRAFEGKVPWRSQLGNRLTRLLFGWLTGVRLLDTQTGLRAIPTAYIPKMMKLKPTGYDFELEMLLLAGRQGWPLHQTGIQTVYIEDNKSSHFNPIRDSLRIYFVLLRFSLSSLLTAVLDYIVFALAMAGGLSLLQSQYLARTIAGLFNFSFNKTFVFHSRHRLWSELLRYFGLVYVLALVSFAMIKPLVEELGWSPLGAKILTEGLLFLASFSIQRFFVFAAATSEESDENRISTH